MTVVMVVVDVQNDFVEGGALAVTGGRKVASDLVDLLVSTAEDENLPVLYTKDWHIEPGEHFASSTGTEPDFNVSWPDHCVADTEGAAFAAEFPDVNPLQIFYKGQYKASYSGVDGVNTIGVKLGEALRLMGAKQVAVVGIAYDYCVRATALDLKNDGFDVYVFQELTASVHPENDAQTTAELRAAGIDVQERFQ